MTIRTYGAGSLRLVSAILCGGLIAAMTVSAAHAQAPMAAVTLHFHLPDAREFKDGDQWEALKPSLPGGPPSTTKIYVTYTLANGQWQPTGPSFEGFMHPDKVRDFTDMGGEPPHFPTAASWPSVWAAPDGMLYFPFPEKGWTPVPLGTRISTFHGPVTLTKRITPAQALQLLQFTVRRENGATYQIRPLYLGTATGTAAAAAPTASGPVPADQTHAAALDVVERARAQLGPATNLMHATGRDPTWRLNKVDPYQNMPHLPEGARTVEDAHILAGDRGWWAQYKLAVARGRWDIIKGGPIGYAALVLAILGALNVVGRLLSGRRAQP